jgi:eukaryotic-like serine/threonine-protein kinase
MTITPGTRFGPYEILARLGSGGMGVVYSARDARLERQVAIKMLPADMTRDEIAKQRFLNEARTASALDHVNICTIHEINESADGELYLVMAHYEGRTLEQRIGQGPLDVPEAIDIVSQVGRGLAEAHRAAIVHRDIKPANVLIARSGVVKILDFGLAKLAGASFATQTGMIPGTVAYMSPEQVQGLELDHRSDLWSLGVVLYEMLAGQRPFKGDNLLSMANAIALGQPEMLGGARPDVSPEIERVIMRLLAKRPVDRYQSADAFIADLTGTPRAGTARQSAVALGSSVPPSIAVLAFTDMSPQKDQDYFCEGMAEEVINALATLEGVHVAARTSSFQFKGQVVDVSEIGRRLRVATLLEGSVRKAGNRLRITAQLVKASDGYQLWSERYDCEMDDIFAVQDQIARSVVSQLRLKLLGDASAEPLVKRHTENVEAYHSFLRGRHCRFSLYDLRGAIGFFEKAVAQDPSYALAHSAIADCFAILGLYAVLLPSVAAAKAKTAAARALQLDDRLPEVHGALAQIAFLFDWNWTDAEREFHQALQSKGAGIENYCWYGYFLATVGRTDEGLVHIQRAAAIDPLSPYVSSYAGVVLYIARRFDEAIAKCRHALEIQPGYGVALNTLALSNSAAGRHDEAVRSAEQFVKHLSRTSHSLGLLGSVLAAAGRHDEARILLQEIQERARAGYVSPMPFAAIFTALGETDHAFAELERAYAERTPMLHSVRFPSHDSLRADPRWSDLIGRMDFPSQQAGTPT